MRCFLHPRRGDPRARSAGDLRALRRARLGPRRWWLWLPRRWSASSSRSVRFPGGGGGALGHAELPNQVHSVLTNPVYAGAYAYGKTRRGALHRRARERLARADPSPRACRLGGCLIWEHHPGFIDRQTFETNQARIARNTRPQAT